MMRVAFVVLIAALASFGQGPPVVTVWLIPAENAGPDDMARGDKINALIKDFDLKLSGSHVTVLNTSDTRLKDKLLSWNPAFAVPNASVVTSQMRTVNSLDRFARNHTLKPSIRVRFITWDEAFSQLNEIDPNSRTDNYPDVVQIGSTWDAYLAKKGLIQSRPKWQTERGAWKDVVNLPASALPFITDVRLLYYWKRLPPSAGAEPLVLNTSTWKSLIESLRERASDDQTVVFPTGLTLNVIHDYAALVWSGRSEFLQSGWFGYRVDLTSAEAMSVPLTLQTLALVQEKRHIKEPVPRRLISFPESSHEEVSRIFVNGGYRVTQEPVNFIDRWRQDFDKRYPKDRYGFWHYAAAAVPPTSFRGGSELVLISGTRQSELACELAEFLASDREFTRVLAEAGHLPSGRPGYGADVLAKSLSVGQRYKSEVQEFVDAVQKAIEQGRSYPQLDFWPTDLENRQVQEAFQVVWRRMGEGDEQKLRQAASDAEWLINSRISWWYDGLDRLGRAWPLIAFVTLITGALALLYRNRQLRADAALVFADRHALAADQQRVKEESLRVRAESERVEIQRNLSLLLYLQRAHRHDAAKYLGDSLSRVASKAEEQGWDFGKVVSELKSLGSLFTGWLAEHIQVVTENQFHEMRGDPSELPLNEVADTAFYGACCVFYAKRGVPHPDALSFDSTTLKGWVQNRFPYALVVVLEEFFLNSLEHIAANLRTLAQPRIYLNFRSGQLLVNCSGSVDPARTAILTEGPSPPLFSGGEGLPLIRNILHHAYGVQATLTNETVDGCVEVKLSIPIRPVPR